MRHRVGFNRLSRKPAHRKALHRNMVTSLFKHERIRTTKAKAQAVRRTAEKMITRAKVDSVHNRRMIARDIKDKAILAKLFTELGPRFKERPGGYTRILKIGSRPGDAAEMVLLELVGDMKESKSKSAPAKKSAGSKSGKAKDSGKTAETAAKPAKQKAAAAEPPEPEEEAAASSAGEEAADTAEEAATEATEVDAPEEPEAAAEPQAEADAAAASESSDETGESDADEEEKTPEKEK